MLGFDRETTNERMYYGNLLRKDLAKLVRKTRLKIGEATRLYDPRPDAPNPCPQHVVDREKMLREISGMNLKSLGDLFVMECSMIPKSTNRKHNYINP